MAPRILFLYDALPQHMRRDRDALSSCYTVTSMARPGRMTNPLSFIKVARAVRKHDLLFLRFANAQNLIVLLIAKFFRKKSILLSGGYDVAKVPEIGYGLTLSGSGNRIVKRCLRLASVVVPFSHSSEAEVRAVCPEANIRTSYVGSIDTDYWSYPDTKREGYAVTVGHIKENNLLRKGIAPFVEAAKHLPGRRFIVVGKFADTSIDRLRKNAPENVAFTGGVSDDELREILQKASVYVQASLHEGFGISLANAMACGAIPVGTKAGSIPEVIGDTGKLIESADPAQIAQAIDNAMSMGKEASQKARDHIVKNFALERRERELLGIAQFVMES